MANEENLIPNCERSPSEARENGKKGGVARGAAQGTTTTEAIGTSGVLNLCAPAFEPAVCLAANFFMGLINFFEPPERKTTN